jgi:hypothetical protein
MEVFCRTGTATGTARRDLMDMLDVPSVERGARDERMMLNRQVLGEIDGYG